MKRDVLEEAYSKTLEYFEEWYDNQEYPVELYDTGDEEDGVIYYGFYDLPTVLQFGVYMDFFSGASRAVSLSKVIHNALPYITDTEEYNRVLLLGFQFLEENGYV